MKKAVTFLFALIFSLSVMGQNQLFSGQPKDSVVRSNPQMDQFNFAPGKLLVKFRDNVSINFKKSRKGLKSSQAFMNQLINKYGITDGNRLFPNEKKLKSVQILTAPNGNKFVRPSLNNIYILKIKSNDPRKLMESIHSLKADSTHVVYAEPDYIYSVTDDKAESPVMTEKQAEQWVQSSPHSSKNVRAGKVKVVTPNDPLYSQQWGIAATQVNQVWDSTTGDTTQIIGILDTGVDWKHPDLKDNIWKNPNPNTVPDANGVVNDIRGWDFVNHDNNPMDDNSHGTHVAGIAAAEGNNGIGIAGVDWHAKIMPIKVFQSDGRGDVATITKGIIYAATHGATVINMSFGSYARSFTMEAALENAYATSVLVAAAGNDDVSIDRLIPPGPFYPAALSYVIGVQATQQQVNNNKSLGFKNNTHLSDYTNYDNDGPIFSRYSSLLNYEMRAPGSGIISTIPNGNYRVYSGTSMSTPLVSGCVALYRQLKPGQSQELMWGNLINTTGSNLQIFNALNSKPKPQLWFVSKTIVDTLAGDNNNGIVDAGETIQLWFKARNTWGQSDSVSVGLKFGEFEDTTTAQILKNTAFIGSISPYATRTNEKTPLLIHINPNVVNNRTIVFEAYLWHAGSTDTVRQKVILTVNHGTYLSGVMDSTLVLIPDKFWIVDSSFRIGVNGTLYITPGAHLIVSKTISVRGTIVAKGTPDSLIIIEGLNGFGPIFNFSGSSEFSYVKFLNSRSVLGDWHSSGNVNVEHSIFEGITFELGNSLQRNFDYNVIRGCSFYISFWNSGPTHVGNNSIYDNSFVGSTYLGNWENNCIANNKSSASGNDAGILWTYEIDTSQFKNNSFIGNTNWVIAMAGSDESINTGKQYWGTNNTSKIRKEIYDFYYNSSLPEALINDRLSRPSNLSPGQVWKVLVDDIDPQDQAKLMNPVGVGVHRFDVYFNRPMDTAYTPHLSFGVRYPYNQQAVTDSGRWSHNNTVWTAYKTVKLLTGDGINRIRVSGARDPEGFEIPVEDMRFQFLISAAESASLDFMATPGLGKVHLEWNNSGLVDLLGFNMYRMEQINDSTLSSPILINKSLILDTLYTDFQVVPNKKYYYFYKVVNTDFSESDSSKVVAAVPYTAALGDANGDLKVNVLDLTTIVAYILGKNPQPFIKAAADINGDSTINILDVIGIVKMILGNKSITADNVSAAEPATIIMKDSTIQLQSDHQLAALQFELKGDSLSEVSLSLLLKGFEFSYGVVNGKIIGLIYSFNGNMIPGGLQNIIKITHAPGELKWGKVFGSDAMGHYVEVDVQTIDGIEQPIILKNSLSVSPNPFSSSVVLKYQVSRRAHVQMEVYNLSGQKVSILQNTVQNAGQYELAWNGRASGNRLLPSGIYFCRLLIVPENGGTVFKKEVKLVMMR